MPGIINQPGKLDRSRQDKYDPLSPEAIDGEAVTPPGTVTVNQHDAAVCGKSGEHEAGKDAGILSGTIASVVIFMPLVQDVQGPATLRSLVILPT